MTKRKAPYVTWPGETEAGFQWAVIALARWYGWLVFHDKDSRRNEPGLPDLIMARRGVVLIAELKNKTGKVSTRIRLTKAGRRLPSQQEWIEASGAKVWRPSDWTEIDQTLKEVPDA